MQPSPPAPFILVIAGSDPSGGAGIQADLRILSLQGAPATAAITCVTVQNSRGVNSISPLPPSLVAAQIKAALDDLDISHVKIGMVGTADIADAIARALSGFKGQVVCDPVLAASSGQKLLQEKNAAAALAPLLSLATVLTPNSRELALLSGVPCDSHQQAALAAAALCRRCPRLQALVVTGGHFKQQSAGLTDLLFLAAEAENGPQLFKAGHRRVATTNDRGTGCSFASSYTAFHQACGSHQQAFLRAGRLVARLLKESARHGSQGATGPMILPRRGAGGGK